MTKTQHGFLKFNFEIMGKIVLSYCKISNFIPNESNQKL